VQGIKDLMEGMKDKEALIHICNTNQERLLLELEKLVVRIVFALTLIIALIVNVAFSCH